MISDESKRFKIFRKKVGLSQKDLALETGRVQSEISKYESGEYAIPMDVIKHLHVKYQMSYNWYFHQEGPVKDKELIKPTLVTDIAAIKDDNKYLAAKVERLDKDLKFLASKIKV